MKQQQHLFTNKMLRALLVPIIMEQLLNALMGTVDTMMVSNVGSAAISAVSLVDSINVLIIQAFSALAAGGTIICTQFLGQKNYEMANKSARQALFIITAISVFIVVLGLAFLCTENGCSGIIKRNKRIGQHSIKEIHHRILHNIRVHFSENKAKKRCTESKSKHNDEDRNGCYNKKCLPG